MYLLVENINNKKPESDRKDNLSLQDVHSVSEARR
jgi:hypothetical protein